MPGTVAALVQSLARRVGKDRGAENGGECTGIAISAVDRGPAGVKSRTGRRSGKLPPRPENKVEWARHVWDLTVPIRMPGLPPGYTVRSGRARERVPITQVVFRAYGSDPAWAQILAGVQDRMRERIGASLGATGCDYIVAEFAGRLVGVCGVMTVHWTGQNLTTGICVLPRHQRQGLGTCILATSLLRLRELGLRSAQVYTESGSVADRKLYPLFSSVRECPVEYPALHPTPPAHSEGGVEHNSYFKGNVQSLGFKSSDGSATVGVMAPGRYTFSTRSEEHVTILAGQLRVKLPNQSWRSLHPGESYRVPAHAAFGAHAVVDVAYVCSFGRGRVRARS
jgi:purine/pyrimidine-nucleoside phosphorylase